MRRLLQAVLAVAIAAGVTLAGYAVAGSDEGGTRRTVEQGVRTVNIAVHYSHFSLKKLHVRQGTLVRFVVYNHDPINHELIVGGPAVQRAHERGSELTHPPVPGEVSVGPDDTGLTAYRFDQPGTVVFACHLPGHFKYGMHGEIEVDPAQ